MSKHTAVHHVSICGWLLLATSIPSLTWAAEPARQEFKLEASLKSWSFNNGPEFPGAKGSIEWDGRQGHDDGGCLGLRYSFADGGNYVQAMTAIPAGTDARIARLWLKKAAGNRVTFRAVDSAGQTFQKALHYSSPDWQQVEVDLSKWDHSFGGPGDNKVHWPLKQLGILIENTANSREGTLLIDDLEFRPAREPNKAAVTYTAADFATAGGWYVGGGAGNSLDHGTWTYQFNAGASPRIGTDFSLLGEPVSLRLTVASDDSGRTVRLDLASHFQSFHHPIGKLTAKGEQVIETPLGKLDGWQHDGGENNGVARMPIRLTGIGLEGDGPKSGSITLKRIEVVTLPRDGQVVVLVPDVVEMEGQVFFKVKAYNLRSASADGKLFCDIRGLSGSQNRRSMTGRLAPNGEPREFAFNCPRGDSAFLEAVFQWVDDHFASKPVSIGLSSVPTDPGSDQLQPDSFVGAGLYLYRYNGAPDYRESLRKMCDLARRAGVKWTREEIQWHRTEPAEGQFDWKFYDDMIDIARAHGISVYGLLDYWTAWSATNTPKGVEQYCRWAREVVKRYKGKIKHWEVWNEPNIFFWSGPKELYAELLKQAYAAIKAEDPDAVVMGCSTAGIDTKFIKNIMDWGGKFDALTIHPYRGQMNDLGFIKELQDVRQLVGGREVWLTEIGFPSQLIDGWSERRQASFVARVYLCTAASGAARSVSWYDFRNDGADPFYNEMNFGLVRNDLRPKPGYGTLATVGRLIGNMRLAEPVNFGPDLCAYRFTDGKQDVLAAWAPDTSRILAVEVPAGIRILNAFGDEIHALRQGGSAIFTLDQGFPVYLVGPSKFKCGAVSPPVAWKIAVPPLQPGQTVPVRVEGVDRWDLPPGWSEPLRQDASTWQLQVPPSAPAYDYDIQAVMKLNGQEIRLPVRITVAPAMLRV